MNNGGCWVRIVGVVLIFILLLALPSSFTNGDTHFNFGLELSGHVIPYFGVSYMSGVREFGFNLGFGLPNDLANSNFSDLAYQGTIYYRYDFINTDFYPRIHLKALSAPLSAGENNFLLMLGGGLGYLYSPGKFRFGGGVELNLGLPVSALDRFSGPIPYLSLETSYKFN